MIDTQSLARGTFCAFTLLVGATTCSGEYQSSVAERTVVVGVVHTLAGDLSWPFDISRSYSFASTLLARIYPLRVF